MRMEDLWRRVDNTIYAFVQKSSESNKYPELDKNAFIMWREPILYAQAGGCSTNTILRGSKTIVSVTSAEEAEALKAAIKETLSAEDLLVKDAETKKKRPFKLVVKTIECLKFEGQLILKKSKIPVTYHGFSAEDALELIQRRGASEVSEIERRRFGYGMNLTDDVSRKLDKEIDEIVARYDSLIFNAASKLDDNQKYCVHYIKSYAMSFRVTYNAAETLGRKQTAVGDVLIVINGTEVIEDKRRTKERSDVFCEKHKEKFITSAAGIGIYADWGLK